jgi:hypothetical protein
VALFGEALSVVRSRLAAASLLVGFLATLAAPCLAAGPGEQAAMACCERMQQACGDSHVAQACCRVGDANQHDRDVQPTRTVAKLVSAAVLSPAVTLFSPIDRTLFLPSLRPSVTARPPTPTRLRPLLI